ncbi:MAG: WbqC family protein [Magnetococcales bacterium]|nr:WbqC family protein [Magnetococcales bacterium]
MTTLAVLQPGYLPWLGFFDQMQRADHFVFYDDVQFDKNGWRNRNRVKSASGPVWLTVPVRHKGLAKPRIMDIDIDNSRPWGKKQLNTLSQLYARAPFRDLYLPGLGEVLRHPWQRLVDLDLALIERMCGWLGLERPLHRSSELGVGGGQSGRLVALCQHFGADTYLTGDSARDYLDGDLFAEAGIGVEWQNYQHPTYPQLHGGFVPYLSTLDLLFNVGPESLALLAGKGASLGGGEGNHD